MIELTCWPHGVQVKVHVLPKAGHWLHVDNAEGLLKLMSSNMAGRQLVNS